ncbi:unnamed protein product [Arctogadus glacialis]
MVKLVATFRGAVLQPAVEDRVPHRSLPDWSKHPEGPSGLKGPWCLPEPGSLRPLSPSPQHLGRGVEHQCMTGAVLKWG